MSWTGHLRIAREHLKASRFDDSLKEVNQALQVGGDREYTVYDCRAAIYEKLGKPKSALQDVMNVIKLAPAHWQGYARASRLFLRVRKLDEATTMANMALARLEPTDSVRRQKLSELKEEVSQSRRRQIYHFGKLPVEIITAIFEMVAAPNWSRVLTLWAVSKHWHNIALNTPNLWSTLILNNRHPVHHAQKWIERSKGRIREISLRSSLSSMPVDLRGLQWSHLRICKIENHDITDYIGGKSKLHRLSDLEELQAKNAPNFNLFLSVPDPKLRRLTLDGVRFSWQALFDYRTLTSLEVRHAASPTFPQLISVLESNLMLEQLILDCDEATSTLLPSDPPTLTLPNLHTLLLATTVFTHPLFELITMPRLETLRLSRIRMADLSPLLEKRPPLILLALNGCIVPNADLLQLLALTPALQTLELTRVDGVANAVIEALVGASTTPLCPALCHLDISHCPDVKSGVITTLLNLRNSLAELPVETLQQPAPARIKSIKADGCPGIQPSSIPWIRTRVEAFSCIYSTKQAASWRR
ncbi:hypothetical protein C8F04DRAFT_503823 [Mycena alexandri]|uniref:F-box domain-containing protein n=1 Tax=Mycena alexandri TaxID=1745969 RepID=A0AAD6RYH1_9AGAR|nr:hypothetical protein C8F04DRAFT_503823 [Mycena alexandri]